MKLLLKVSLPLAALGGLGWWLILGVVPEAVVESVGRGVARDGVPGNVRVLAARTHDLRARTQGVVKNVALLPYGKPVEVEMNATLIELDPKDLRRSLEQLGSSRRYQDLRLAAGSAVEMQLESERKELEAWRALADKDQVAPAELEKKENLVKRLEAQWEHEKIGREETEENFDLREAELRESLRKLTVRSPIDGVMTYSLVAPGDMVFTSGNLGQVISKERLVEVLLNEEDFAGVREGLEVAVSLLSHGGAIFEGKVSRLSATVDAASGRRKLYVDLEGGNERFAPGSSGRAEIIRTVKKDALVIPRKALMGNAVFVVKDGVARAREVKVGARNLLTAEILEGLEEGERVIVETPQEFRDGQKVKPVVVSGS